MPRKRNTETYKRAYQYRTKVLSQSSKPLPPFCMPEDPNKTITVDPDGDLLLVFEPPVENQNEEGSNPSSDSGVVNSAIESDDEYEDANDHPFPPSIIEINHEDVDILSSASSDTKEYEDMFGTSNPDPNQDQDTDEASSTSHSTTASSHGAIPAKHTYRILVSSKHLMLASPVFRAMLSGPFLEGVAFSENKSLTLPLDDDPKAMLIILYIIRSRNKLVPIDIDLDLWFSIAVLVDKYDMHSAISAHPIVPIWRAGFSTTFKGGRSWKTNLQWLVVAWVFRFEEDFKSLTRFFMVRLKDKLNVLIDREHDGYPIPQTVIDAINEERESSIGKAFSLITYTIEQYERRFPLCNYHPQSRRSQFMNAILSKVSLFGKDVDTHRKACEASVRESLTQSAMAQGMLPIPENPYKGWSMYQFVKKMKELRVQTLCVGFNCNPDVEAVVKDGLNSMGLYVWSLAPRGMGPVVETEDAHGVSKFLENGVDSVHTMTRGLQLQDFTGGVSARDAPFDN